MKRYTIICFILLLSFSFSSCNSENVADSTPADLQSSNIDSQSNDFITEEINNNEYPFFSEEYLNGLKNGKLKKEYSEFLKDNNLSEQALLNSIYEIMRNVNTFDKIRTDNGLVETIDISDTISIEAKDKRPPQNILDFSRNYTEIAYRYSKRIHLKENVSIGKFEGDIYTPDFKQKYVQDEDFDKYINDLKFSIDSFITSYMDY